MISGALERALLIGCSTLKVTKTYLLLDRPPLKARLARMVTTPDIASPVFELWFLRSILELISPNVMDIGHASIYLPIISYII